MTPLHLAALKKRFNIAEILIRSGADVNAIDKVSSTLIPAYRYCTVCMRITLLRASEDQVCV